MLHFSFVETIELSEMKEIIVALCEISKNLSLLVWMMRNLPDCLTLVVQIMSLKMKIKCPKQLKSIKKAMIISAVSRLLEKLDGVKNIHTVIQKKNNDSLLLYEPEIHT